MDIREPKRPPIFDDPDTYDEIVAYAEGSVADAPILREPANVATLATLLVFETMVARANQRTNARVLELIAKGVRPHAMPADTAAIHVHLTMLRGVLRAIDLVARPPATDLGVGEAQLRAAGISLYLAGRAASALGFLDEAALGWRGFRVDGRTIELRHRSPERLRRRIEGAVHAEAAHNAPFVDGAVSGNEERFYREINALQDGADAWNWMHADALIAGALLPARRAGIQLHRWDLADEVEIGDPPQFSIREFRRIVEVVHAIATVGDLVGDGIRTLGASRVLRGPRERWVEVLSHHVDVPRDRVAAALEFMTRRAADEPRGRGSGRSATTNPFFDLGAGELALAVTCAMWQDPRWALLATWSRRAPQDFGAKVAQRGHDLAREIYGLFRERGWVAVLEEKIIGSDLDVAAGAREDNFLIAVEAKAFVHDPVRQAEDPKAWTQLADNVDEIRDPNEFRRVFEPAGLVQGQIVGLLVVPEFMTPATEHGDEFGVLGVANLRELAAQSATPRELWGRIKGTETAATFPLQQEELAFGRWILRFDIGDRNALPAAVRVRR